jgi:hypothetical protein
MYLKDDATVPKEEDIVAITRRRIEVENFPIFTQQDPQDILEDYLSKCAEDGTGPMIDPTNLPVKPPKML